MPDFTAIERGQKVLDALASRKLAYPPLGSVSKSEALGADNVPHTEGADADENGAAGKGLSDGDRAAVERLAQLSPIEYDRVRKSNAKALHVRESTLDKLVKDCRKDQDRTDGIDFDDVEPWASPVDLNQLLTDLATTIRRFIVCNDATAHSAALWVTMTWFMEVVQVAPLAVITAPEKRCGKSMLLAILGRLVYRPLMASNITPAALFRSVDAWKPTLLVDEADAFMRDNEELRGLLNCGHTRDSAYIVRVVGDDHVPTKFCVWGAKALAGIGHLADTIMDRSIVLELRRKLPHEQVMRLRHAEPGLIEDLAAKLARVAVDYREAMRNARPELPAKLNDRAQDNWEPLLALADIAGGVWPELARKAALTISGSADDHATIGTELLADIREVFESKATAKISTAELIAAMCADEEKPWATYNRGKPIRPRQVSKKLGEFSIASKNLRIAGIVCKGFERDQFSDAFSRYLVAPSPQAQHRYKEENPFADNTLRVADGKSSSGNEIESATQKHQSIQGGSVVADRTPQMGGNTIVEIEV